MCSYGDLLSLISSSKLPKDEKLHVKLGEEQKKKLIVALRNSFLQR